MRSVLLVGFLAAAFLSEGLVMRPDQHAVLAPTWTPCQGPAASVLVMVLSCANHSEHWDEIRDWGTELGASAGFVILWGNASLEVPYKLHRKTHMLDLKVKDGYEMLPEKLLRGYAAMLREATFTHVFKIDDTDMLSRKHMGLSATVMQDQLRGVPHDYLAPPHGVVLTDHRYMSNTTIDWGIERTSNDSYWRMYGPIVCNDTFAYANGGATYILSIRAVQLLVATYPEGAMDALLRFGPLEDYAWGITLHRHGINVHVASFENLDYFWGACDVRPPPGSGASGEQGGCSVGLKDGALDGFWSHARLTRIALSPCESGSGAKARVAERAVV